MTATTLKKQSKRERDLGNARRCMEKACRPLGVVDSYLVGPTFFEERLHVARARDQILIAMQKLTMKRPPQCPTHLDAEQRAAHWLHLGNKARERGQRDLAERHYTRAQAWHDKMNGQLGKA